MAYTITTPATYTDPEDTELVVDSDEVEEAVISIMRDEGIEPQTVTLNDEYTDEPIEITVSDFLSYQELVVLRKVYI